MVPILSPAEQLTDVPYGKERANACRYQNAQRGFGYSTRRRGTGAPPTKDALNTPGYRRTAAVCETHTCRNCVRYTDVHEVMLNENKELRLSDPTYMCLFMSVDKRLDVKTLKILI